MRHLQLTVLSPWLGLNVTSAAENVSYLEETFSHQQNTAAPLQINCQHQWDSLAEVEWMHVFFMLRWPVCEPCHVTMTMKVRQASSCHSLSLVLGTNNLPAVALWKPHQQTSGIYLLLSFFTFILFNSPEMSYYCESIWRWTTWQRPKGEAKGHKPHLLRVSGWDIS